MIRATSITFSYDRCRPVLLDLSFEVPSSSTCVIIGPSGCGKTTLLYLLAGILVPQNGEITINGTSVCDTQVSYGLILQDYGLFPWLTIYNNIALGLKIKKQAVINRQQIINQLVEELQLHDFLHAYPAQCSGGQKQRAALARSLALKPDYLLLDEPFSSLDALTREKLQDLLLTLWHRHQTTLIIVTHNIEEAVYLGQQIIVLPTKQYQEASIITNPHWGYKANRGQFQYLASCNHLRHLLGAN